VQTLQENGLEPTTARDVVRAVEDFVTAYGVG
jgi:hypothetical protein